MYASTTHATLYSWHRSLSLPTCTMLILSHPVVDCDAPPVLLNGYTLQFNTTYNSIVTYRCNSPYVFSEASSENRTCLLSGHWSEGTITCCEWIGAPTTCSSISIELWNSPFWVVYTLNNHSHYIVLLTWTRHRTILLPPHYPCDYYTPFLGHIAYISKRALYVFRNSCVFVCLACISLENFLSFWDATASLQYSAWKNLRHGQMWT